MSKRLGGIKGCKYKTSSWQELLFSSHLFWSPSSLGIPAGVTQEEGHTGFLIHLPSAVYAFIFLARRIQPFLSLVGREVEFCVLHSLGVFFVFCFFFSEKNPFYWDRTHFPTCQKVTWLSPLSYRATGWYYRINRPPLVRHFFIYFFREEKSHFVDLIELFLHNNKVIDIKIQPTVVVTRSKNTIHPSIHPDRKENVQRTLHTKKGNDKYIAHDIRKKRCHLSPRNKKINKTKEDTLTDRRDSC